MTAFASIVVAVGLVLVALSLMPPRDERRDWLGGIFGCGVVACGMLLLAVTL